MRRDDDAQGSAPEDGNPAPDPGGSAPDTRRPASLAELFLTFNRLALHGFGGVQPWASRVLVDERRWLTATEFVEMLAFSRLVPGPNVCNLAIMFGDRHFGVRGALAALAGLVAVPGVLVLVVAAVHGQFAHLPSVQRAIAAMAAVAAGLMIATALRLARTQPARWLALGALAFVAVGVLRWPLVTVMAALVPAAIGFGWRSVRGVAARGGDGGAQR